MRTQRMSIRWLAVLSALCTCVALGVGAAAASAAVPTVRNDHPGELTVAAATAAGTVSTDAPLRHGELRIRRAASRRWRPQLPRGNPAERRLRHFYGTPISGPGEVPPICILTR